MLRIDKISDIEQLRQVAQLLEKENARLHKRLEEMTRELSELKGQDFEKQLSFEIEKLQSQISNLQKMLFGSTSEKRRKPKDENTNNDNEEEQKRRGHGPKEQPTLPNVTVTCELDEKERVCEFCGGIAKEWEGQEQSSEVITVVQRLFVLKTIIQKKYRCSCGACIKLAPRPATLIKGGRFSPEFAVEVATEKYLDHMPLERQVRKMGREGLDIDSQTLWDQLWALACLLEPVYDAIFAFVMSFSVICADESPWYMLKKGPRKRWYIWGASCPFAVYYLIDPSRGSEVAEKLLGTYQGTIITDGYQGYDILARAGPDRPKPTAKLGNCWGHSRRKFVKSEKDYPLECEEVLDMIGELYEIEQRVPNPWTLPKKERKETFAMLAKLRDTESREILGRIKTWAKGQLALPESTFREAVEYVLGHWNKLTLFLEDPRIPLDTNQIERGFRGPAVGRKNHYGSKSTRGITVAQILYTLVESAKLCGVNPHEYLLAATKRALDTPGAVLMPHEFRVQLQPEAADIVLP
jgi:transposase